MTLDIDLDIAPDGDTGLTLTLQGSGGPAIMPRPQFTFDRVHLEKLRLGQAAEAEAAPVATAISDWLLGTDLREHLAPLLVGHDDLRVVLRADRDLLAQLSDLPIELVSMPGTVLPLVLHPRVTSLVRVPPAVGAVPPVDVRGWPLRVLIVRSNPDDLGGVPEALPIKAAIDEIVEGMGLSAADVSVEVLSREDGGDRVTWSAFREQLKKGPYHVLVYLGHGQVTKVDDANSVGYLQFEEGAGHTPIDGGSIAGQLIQRPARIVILAGCLTAAGGGSDELVPDSLRGAQGVAQAIIGSEAPVELAVGMRDLLEVSAASQLLVAFFRSLLKEHPGDVERSIREARFELFGNGRYPPSWSSAVVYTKGPATLFSFLAEKPPATRADEETRLTLDKIRETRRNMALGFLSPIPDRTAHLSALAVVGELEKQVIGKDPMIRPRFVQANAGEIEIAVELLGSLKIRRITGTVSINGGAGIQGLDPAARLDDKFTVLSGVTNGSVLQYSIDAVATGGARLAAGPLFTIRATVPGPAPAIHEVTAARTRSDPERAIWSGVDLVAVVG